MVDFVFKIAALTILAIFYLIYIGKMISQKKKGIVTDQIAKGKKQNSVFITERVMKFATYGIVVIQIISIVLNWNRIMPVNARLTGVIVALIGDAIFGLAVWTMKDSWRAGIPEKDRTNMVTSGIYAYSRNPAFLGFDFMYIGIMLLYFNPLLILFTVFSMVMLHLQILQEEKFLPTVFGNEYSEYRSKVFRYMGRRK